MIINLHRTFFEIISKSRELEITPNYMEFLYDEEIANGIDELNIKFETLRQNRYLRIEKRDLPFNIFKRKEEYLKLNNIVSESNILILDRNNEPLSFVENETYQNFEPTINNYFFSNALSYKRFLDFLQSLETEKDCGFHFVDYYNRDLRKIVLTSISEKGRLIIQYEREIPLFNDSKDLSKGLEKFKTCFQEPSDQELLPRFLKDSFIEIASKLESKERCKKLFESLEIIVERARINFDLYLSNISVANLKNDFDELKTKYFHELSEVLNKLTQKIIGLPIGLTASLFAVEGVKENHLFLWIMIAALAVASIYLSLLIRINYRDIIYSNKIFQEDYLKLTEFDFFTKYPNEKEPFEEIEKRFNDRIVFLKRVTESYFWILNLTNAIIIGYILNIFGFSENGILLIIVFFLIIISIARNNYIFKP